LIHILDQKTENDLLKWSEVWVNTAGRPEFSIEKGLVSTLKISQSDPNQMSRIWPQFFELQLWAENEVQSHGVISDLAQVLLPVSVAPDFVYPNSNGFGYGLFPQSVGDFRYWKQLDVVARGSALINLYENMLDGKVEAAAYYNELVDFIPDEENQLILNLALDHLRTIYWKLFDDAERRDTAQELEAMLWQAMLDQEEASRRKIFFNSWENVVLTSEELDRLYRIWDESYTVDNLPLSENDFIGMAGTLALKDPAIALGVISTQLGNIQNTDRRRRFEFIAPALSPDQSVRDAFFESLGEELNRQTESWVLGALAYLHHPLRVEVSEKYLLPSLELLEEIQITGDIFFPGRWMSATLGNYHSDTAVETVRTFLADRPLYNYQLRLKILQAADMMFRVNEIWKGE
jgi:aminopeptidase N